MMPTSVRTILLRSPSGHASGSLELSAHEALAPTKTLSAIAPRVCEIRSALKDSSGHNVNSEGSRPLIPK